MTTLTYYLMHDASGNVIGSGITNAATIDPTTQAVTFSDPNCIACTEAQYGNSSAYMVDMTQTPPAIASLPAAELQALQQADTVAANTATQVNLMAAANAATLGMADAFSAGLLNATDTATFKSWAAYKLALAKVTLTQTSPAWPALPA